MQPNKYETLFDQFVLRRPTSNCTTKEHNFLRKSATFESPVNCQCANGTLNDQHATKQVRNTVRPTCFAQAHHQSTHERKQDNIPRKSNTLELRVNCLFANGTLKNQHPTKQGTKHSSINSFVVSSPRIIPRKKRRQHPKKVEHFRVTG